MIYLLGVLLFLLVLQSLPTFLRCSRRALIVARWIRKRIASTSTHERFYSASRREPGGAIILWDSPRQEQFIASLGCNRLPIICERVVAAVMAGESCHTVRAGTRCPS